MKNIATLLGGGRDSASKMMKIYNFESSIAKVSYKKLMINMYVPSQFRVNNSTIHHDFHLSRAAGATEGDWAQVMFTFLIDM